MDCILPISTGYFHFRVIRCLIVYPDIKCVNLSVIYILQIGVWERLKEFNMPFSAGVGCFLLSSYSALTAWVMVKTLVMR